ncbi:MAG: recombination regulator RecX [Lachnospiraceae bacterium]|nr:recombination regulator RecX [Lachnospiraceae bacterium]
MEVTAIETVTRNKMRVFLDGEPAFVVSRRSLTDLGIREGSSFSDEEAGEFMKKVYRLAAMSAMEILTRRDHTRQELMEKLSVRGYSEEISRKALEYVESFNYIDEERYAAQFIESRRGRDSLAMLKRRLRERGLSDEDIERAVEASGWDDSEGIKRAIVKKFGSEEGFAEADQDTMVKFVKGLISKGYRYQDIRRFLL